MTKNRAYYWLQANGWVRYAIAFWAFAVSVSIRLALQAWLSSDRGFIVFLPAILLVTFFVGLEPAIMTSILSGIALWYVFLPPFYSFALTLDGVVGLATFAFGSLVGIALVHWLRVLINRADIERTRVEALAASVTSDLRDMTLLNQLGNTLVRDGRNVEKCLNEILETAIAIAGAKKGNVQLFDLDSQTMVIAAQRGFHDLFLKQFERVGDNSTACALAMHRREQVIVEDIRSSDIFIGHPSQNVMLGENVHAVISTPLTSSIDILLGMISVHFDRPHRPAEQQLRLVSLLARQAADYLERKRAEQIEEILVREVQHRSNNLLSVVQAIANRSLSGAYSLSEAKKAFEARLHALARANRQLTNSNWSGVDLTEIAQLELEPFGNRVRCDGIHLILGAQYAQNFSLALHELATNAAKYGALSNETGQVAVSWTIMQKDDRRNHLKFRWEEKGGPPTMSPNRAGFGTSLLNAMFLNVHFDYALEGLICEFEVVLQDKKLDAGVTGGPVIAPDATATGVGAFNPAI